MQNLISLLIEDSTNLISLCDIKYKRYFYNTVDFSQKLVGVVGARGVGKTTTLLQYLQNLSLPHNKKLYISADMIEISDVHLFEIARAFEKYGGEVLAIDEIHKNRSFEQELKNIYDRLQLRVIFSGSSALKIEYSKADLSRRADIYKVFGLSFREFLEIKLSAKLKPYSLDDILLNHTDISASLIREFKPLEHFIEYIKYGYYPFYFEEKKRYLQRLERTINSVIEVDLPSIFSMKYENIVNLKKLIKLICSSVPYKINISELSKKIGINRDRLYLYIDYLSKGSILLPLKAKTKGDKIFTKPSKLYLQNPNLYSAYCKNNQIGTIRESFFATMLNINHTINYSDKGDFLVDSKYIFEVGGKNKSFKQIEDMPDSFVIADDIEVGFGNKIPLWLFGFLY